MSPTPILDLEQDPPKAQRSWAAIVITVLITAIFVAPLLADLITSSAPAFNGLLWLPALYVGIAIHEIGHLLAGKLAGMNPGAISVGGFQLFKSGSRWVFRLDLRQFAIGGFARPLPAKNDFRRDHFAWMVAGGPIASILFTVVCVLAMSRFGSGAWDWISTLFWGSTLGWSSLIPYSTGGLKSDAALLWQLLRHPEHSRHWIALLALQTEETHGTLPRDWDPALMDEVLTIDNSQAHYAGAQMFASYRSIDLSDTETALQHLENALAASSRSGAKKLSHVCCLEAAAISARERKNPAQARTWLARATKIQKPQSTFGIEAEIAIAEGRFDDAIGHLAAARAYIERRRLDSGLARFSKERIAEREGVCHAALRSTEAAASSS